MSLCVKHRRQYEGWLDYKEPITGWIQFQASHEQRVKMSLEAHKSKVDERRKLIRSQVEGVVAACRSGSDCSDEVLVDAL